jgi:alpha-galactosidase
MMEGAAAALDRMGLRAKGYVYINFDCGWTTGFRDTGGLQVNTTAFPDIHGYAARLRNGGFKVGVYAGGGPKTDATHHSQCCSRAIEGANDTSYDHWEQDVAFLIGELGAEYLKSDPCGGPNQEEYVLAHNKGWVDALNKSGHLGAVHFQGDIECQQSDGLGPSDRCGEATAAAANSWRTTADIRNTWESVLSNIEQNDGAAPFAGPGHWNDPDLLEVGNPGLTDTEARAQFSLWCLAKAPLLISADPSTLSVAALETLGSADAIMVNQDVLGVQGRRVSNSSSGAQVWAGPLSGGAFAVVLLNTATAAQEIKISRQALLAAAALVGGGVTVAARLQASHGR